MPFGNYMETIIYSSVFLVLGLLSLFIAKTKKTKLFAVCVLISALIFEVFAVNFHSFHLVGGKYPETEIDLTGEDITIEGAILSGSDYVPAPGSKNITVTLTGTNIPVGTVKLGCTLPESTQTDTDTFSLRVSISAKDETQAAFLRYGVASGRVIRGNERSEYIVLDLSGKVSELQINIEADGNKQFSLNSITLNSPVPFRFSTVRLLLIFVFSICAYALMNFPSLLRTHEEEKKRFTYLTLVITVIAVIGALFIAAVCNYDRNGVPFQYITLPDGDQITQELVDAFRAGQVSLLKTPSEELLAMDNPYDASARIAQNIDFLWDHLLFEGKYYSYYGIAPVILLFLPFNLITGAYMSSFWAVFIFGSLGIVFLTLAFNRFCDIYAKKIPLNILVSTLVILLVSSGIWFCFSTPKFYEIAQSSGFMFTAAGFWLLLSSGVLGGGKIRYGKIALSVFCQATAVLCRPTLALYCIVSLVALAFGFFRIKKELADESKKKKRTGYIKYLSSALVLYAVIGGGQMVYNYVRFGSFFDFGIQYSLTINDFIRSQYATDFVMIGFYNFLFAFPVIKPEFPYIFSNFSILNTNGAYFVANYIAIGLPFRALPAIGLFGAGKAMHLLTKDERKKALAFAVPTCIVIPLAIIFSIWESGYGIRYCCDFAWQMVLGGAAVFYLLYVRKYSDNETMRKIIRGFFVTAMFAAVAVNFSMIYEYMNIHEHLEAVRLTYESLFDFWK